MNQILIINEQDIAKVVQASELVGSIEKAYLIQDNTGTYIPDRMHLNYNGNTQLLMPGFIKSIAGTKLVSVFPDNTKKNLPVINGVMILNDIATGEPKAIINASKLTAIRTGAVGATAVKYLAPENARILGVIGAGVQAFHQVLLSIEQRAFDRIIIYDSYVENANSMKRNLSDLDCTIEISESSNTLVQKSDVIITATSSNDPVFYFVPLETEEKLFVGVGSYKPNMQEFPLDLFKNANEVFVDTPFAIEESGDLKNPLEKQLIEKKAIIPFCEVIKGTRKKKSNYNIFKSVGMSLFDLTVGELIFKKSLELEIGSNVKF